MMSSLQQTKQWGGCVAHMANMKNAQNILVEKP
jgi:hypothetical protein